jgi:hypothetical protein
MAKKAKAKREKAQPGVLGSLPSQRPDRIGGRRDHATTPAPEAAAGPPPAAEKPRRAKAAARSRPAASAPPEAPATAAPATPPRRRPAPPPPPPAAPRRGPPRGTELVTTAIQAAGELAQIGLTAGGKALKRAVDRVPRP